MLITIVAMLNIVKYVLFVLLLFVECDDKNDYSKKAKLKLSEIINENQKYPSESWPPQDSDEYFRVGVKLFGDKNPSAFDAEFRPAGQHLNPKKLKKIFWKYNLDLNWLSIYKPPVLSGYLPSNNELKDEMKNLGKSLNFTFTDSVGTLLEIPENMQNLFKQWLLDYSSCKMNFVWEDLGEIFWPRWIKRGICSNSKSCSWPSGMMCKYSGSKTLYLLRWICDKDSDGSKAKAHKAYMDELKKRKQKRKRFYRSNNKRRRRHRENGNRNRTSRSSNNRRSQRRAERIMNVLSKEIKGHFCQWSMLKYYISDRCSCQCK